MTTGIRVTAQDAPRGQGIPARFRSEGLLPRVWSNGPGDRYGWHSHPYHKVLYCAKGTIVFHTRQGDYRLEAGDRLDVEPGTEHANLGQRHLQPAPVGAYPAGASPLGVHQLIGDVWEWTGSDFAGYPGFTAFPYREYSEVFFGPDYKVLRGGSFGTDPVACRGTFRNWDYPIRRQIFAGFRTARSAA